MNLDLDSFTYITGIAGLLGLLLQFKDSFPEHRDIRKSVVLIVIGVFVGSLVSSLRGVKVDFGTTISPFEVLVGVYASVLAIIAMLGALSSDGKRRYELFSFAGLGTVGLFVLLLFGSMVSGVDSREERERKQLTIEELMELSNANAARGNYDRALYFIDLAKLRIPRSDERFKSLESRVSEIKIKQVSPKW